MVWVPISSSLSNPRGSFELMVAMVHPWNEQCNGWNCDKSNDARHAFSGRDILRHRPERGVPSKTKPGGNSPPGSATLSPRRQPGRIRIESMTAYADPLSLSTHADQALLYRSSAALRMLRLMQSWAANHLVEPGRGIVWIARGWLQKQMGVSRSQYFRALARLRSAGWIVASTVADETGHERPGYRVALQSSDGFATAMRPRCDLDATAMRPKCDSPTLKLIEENMNEGKAVMSRYPRQSNLPGSEFQQQARAHLISENRSGSENEPGTENNPGKCRPRRDPRLNEVASRVDEYERARYIQHPRCVRPKRDTPEAHQISVEAITRALERVVESKVYDTLETIETRFRAVVELNWDAADRKAETWDWWTGSAMWAPISLDRVLGWLDEQRNWIYLERADGRSELPSRADDTGLMPDDIGQLSPADQQRAYDEAHGIESAPKWPDTPAVEWAPTKTAEQVLADVPAMMADEAVRFDAIQRRRSSSHSSWNRETGEITDHPDFGAAVDGFAQAVANHVRIPKHILMNDAPGDIARESELAGIRDRKVAYLRSTTPEERAEDAKAGRQPWEVG